MTQHCKANPCCGDVPCSGVPVPQDASGLVHHNPETVSQTMTSNEAFFKATEIIDKAVADLVEASKEPALRFAHELTKLGPLFDPMTDRHARLVAEYMEAEMEASQAKIQEAVKNAFA